VKELNQNGDDRPEMRGRIVLGRTAMNNSKNSMNNIWKNQDTSHPMKCRLVNLIIFPIASYSCETWILRKTDKKKDRDLSVVVLEITTRHPMDREDNQHGSPRQSQTKHIGPL
ncbi:hypothetical protein JRQ81_017183, partial [Phrynocephalus forsythii]